jgi:hypothetical protein
MSHEDDGRLDEPLDGRRRRLGLGVGMGAAALAVAIAATLALTTGTDAPDRSAAPAPTAASMSSAAATSTPSAIGLKQPAPRTTPTLGADPAALADLDAIAATVSAPLALTSPATWDQWLPEGKPFPGTSTEGEMSTCPRLSDRLGRVLGTKMSYWSGTLPGGPYGCTWAPVPLVYDSPDYDYVISVGFVADGTTPSGLARSFATAGGPLPVEGGARGRAGSPHDPLRLGPLDRVHVGPAGHPAPRRSLDPGRDSEGPGGGSGLADLPGADPGRGRRLQLSVTGQLWKVSPVTGKLRSCAG